MGGSIQAAQDMAFDSMNRKELQFGEIVMKDLAVAEIADWADGGCPYPKIVPY